MIVICRVCVVVITEFGLSLLTGFSKGWRKNWCSVYMLQVVLMAVLIVLCAVCVVVVTDIDMCSQTGFSKSWRKVYIYCPYCKW